MVLLAQIGLMQPLAAGQQSLYEQHVDGFPKAAWVVDDDVPVNTSPQLDGHLAEVLHKGDFQQVAGLGTPVLHSGVFKGLEAVVAVPLGAGGARRRPGYLVASHIAVFETLLGHCSPGDVLFASVTGARRIAGVDGFVLDVSVWLRRGEGVPSRVLSGPNSAPGLAFFAGTDGGAAVGLDGRVVVLGRDGAEVWRSPAGPRFVLNGQGSAGFEVTGPDGTVTVPLP